MQISLLPGEQLDPLPTSSGHYVAVLQSQPGERDALMRATPATWERMTPLIELVGQKDQTKVFPVTTVRAWLKRVADSVGEHPIYLDLVRLNPAAQVTTARTTSILLQEVYVAARRRALKFIPVLRVGESTQAHVAMMCEAMDEDQRGIALRYRFLNAALPADLTRATLLASTLGEIGCDPEHADLLLDLDYIDPDVDIDIAMLTQSIDEMVSVGAWRSVVLIGTTMPETLACIDQGTVGTLPRREWEIWTRVAGSGMNRVPAFGDYAVQNPHPPHEGGGPGMRANIRYTATGATVVARGEGSLIQEGSEQYRELCAQLVARPEFSGRDYSWGDGVIAGCADGSVEPGWQNQWRGAATSHHLRLVTDQLRTLYP